MICEPEISITSLLSQESISQNSKDETKKLCIHSN
nr:MAG TPA: hypothetical protein [Caudoviricetes sp.]